MHFVGIFSKGNSFQNIKEEILNELSAKDINIINITSKNIENLKNISFETIIICNQLTNFTEHQESIKKLLMNSKYIIINSEVRINNEFFEEIKSKIITYGLNQKSTITISSVSEENVLISLQRNLENIKGKTIEMEEKNIHKDKNNGLKVEDFMIIFAISLIYS